MKHAYMMLLAALTVTLMAGAAEPPKKETKLEPRFIELPAMTMAGIAIHATPEAGKFAELWHDWQQISPYAEGLEVGTYAYGVELFPPNFAERRTFTYMAASKVSDIEKVPVHLLTRTLPAAKYAVFTVPEGIEGLKKTFPYIYGEWLPKSGYAVAFPFDMERYNFGPEAMKAGGMVVEILVPVKEKK